MGSKTRGGVGWGGGGRGWKLCVGACEGWCKGREEVHIGRFGGIESRRDQQMTESWEGPGI